MRQVSLLIKPASSLCNMQCKYCFYKDESKNREASPQKIMSSSTMQNLIDKSLELSVDQVNYCFQGGEPTLAGIEYFQQFTSYANEKRKLKKVTYAIQTNGLLLDKDWVKLFKDYDFLVGISLDGFLENHDYFRLTSTNLRSFKTILKSIDLLKEYNIRYNILTVLTSKLAEKPDRLFNFYKKYNIKYIQLIPCLPSLNGNEIMDKFALKPKQFAEFYRKFFDRWYQEYANGNYISVTLFDNLIPMFNGVRPQQCGMLGSCAMQIVVEADGNVYPCDFYALDEYLCGNINNNSLKDIMNHPNMFAFLTIKREYCNKCSSCRFISICNGNCRRLASCYYDRDYCGYQQFLHYAYERMLKIAIDLRK